MKTYKLAKNAGASYFEIYNSLMEEYPNEPLNEIDTKAKVLLIFSKYPDLFLTSNAICEIINDEETMAQLMSQ